MRAKIVICDLCGTMTKEGEILIGLRQYGSRNPFVLAFQLEPRQISEDVSGSDKHVCQDCIHGIKKYQQGEDK